MQRLRGKSSLAMAHLWQHMSYGMFLDVKDAKLSLRSLWFHHYKTGERVCNTSAAVSLATAASISCFRLRCDLTLHFSDVLQSCRAQQSAQYRHFCKFRPWREPHVAQHSHSLFKGGSSSTLCSAPSSGSGSSPWHEEFSIASCARRASFSTRSWQRAL